MDRLVMAPSSLPRGRRHCFRFSPPERRPPLASWREALADRADPLQPASDCTTLAPVDEKAIRRAARITLQVTVSCCSTASWSWR